MSFRIAELLTRAEHATAAEAERLREQATNAILKVWDHRKSWPRGWPPSALKMLGLLSDDRRSPSVQIALPKRPTWLEALATLERIHEAEEQAWLDRALVECPVDEAQLWLDERGAQMDKDERDALIRVVSAARRVQQKGDLRLGGLVDDGQDEEKAQTPAGSSEARIAELARLRQKLRRSVVPGWPHS